jgi:6-phosphogluconolactonase
MNSRPRWMCSVGLSTFLLFFSATATFAAAPRDADARVADTKPEKMLVFIGTYTRGKSKGIYSGELDLATGKLSISGVAPSVEPSFLAVDPTRRFLYAVNEVEQWGGKKNAGGVSAFAIDSKSGQLKALNQQSSEGAAPCHISVDSKGKFALVANYMGGNVAVLPIESDGSLGKATSVVQHKGEVADAKRQGGPHAHSISLDPSGRFALAADLGLDKVFIYRFDGEIGKLTPNDPPSGQLAPRSGPRHFAFSRDGRFVYVINEIAMTITSFAYDAERGALKPLATVSTLPKGVVAGDWSTAEIEVRPDGRFLYGTNRGHDSLVIFAIDPRSGQLTYVGHQPSGGKTPRSFGIDPTGSYLLSANQDSDNIVVMRIARETGKLTPTGQTVEVGMPVCVIMIPAPQP